MARALVLEPEVLLFDEPLSNLDAKLRRRVREEIRELQQKLGLTSVYVTHDQGEALAVSDRIIVMRDAEIAQAGSPRELYDQPLDLFVADFIGDANLIEAEITAVNGALATVRIGPLTRALPHRGLAPGPAHVALRPETIQLVPEARPDAIAGEVAKATYLGSHMEYTVSTAEGDLFVIDHEVERALRPGTAVLGRPRRPRHHPGARLTPGSRGPGGTGLPVESGRRRSDPKRRGPGLADPRLRCPRACVRPAGRLRTPRPALGRS